MKLTQNYNLKKPDPSDYARPDPFNDNADAIDKALKNIETALGDKLGTSGDGKDVTVTFAQAASRANINTGEKLSVLLGKIRKWFADLGTAAFKAVEFFAEATHTHKKSEVTDFAHKSSHAIGGNDQLVDSDIGISSDVATALGLTGDPQAKDAFNKLGDLYRHWWRKHSVTYTQGLGAETKVQLIATPTSNYNTPYPHYYSSSVTISPDGTVLLVNPQTVQIYPTGVGADTLKGKYWSTRTTGGNVYFTKSNAQIDQWYTEYGNPYYYVEIHRTSSVSAVAAPNASDYEYISGALETTYPKNGAKNGFWYVYVGKPFYNALSPGSVSLGTYTGTGTYGRDNPNTIAVNSQTIAVIVSVISADEFEGCTSAIFIKGASSASANKLSSGAGQVRTIYISQFDDTQLKYYSDESVNGVPIQLNRNGYVYRYVLLSLS